jgi:hypothetical protein
VRLHVSGEELRNYTEYLQCHRLESPRAVTEGRKVDLTESGGSEYSPVMDFCGDCDNLKEFHNPGNF